MVYMEQLSFHTFLSQIELKQERKNRGRKRKKKFVDSTFWVELLLLSHVYRFSQYYSLVDKIQFRDGSTISVKTGLFY